MHTMSPKRIKAATQLKTILDIVPLSGDRTLH